MFINNVANREFVPIVANFTGPVRMDRMAGRDHLVIPMVMMVEGVLNGSKGPILYTKDEMSKFPAAWNSKPVVVYHPQMNGRGISACDPAVITNRGIGTIMNTKIGEVEKVINNETVKVPALKAEAWCEIGRMDEIDDRIAAAVENGTTMELSTGLYVEADTTPGEFNGTPYDMIARNFQPDHLAVLPDLTGACSMEDGAGFLLNQVNVIVEGLSDEEKEYAKNNSAFLHIRLQAIIENEMSHGDIRSLLGSALRAELNDENLWVEDVFNTFFIYEDDGKLFKRSYTVTDGKVALTGTATEVVRITEFRTLDGKFVGNRKEQTMNKKKLVDGLIANESTSWTESDHDSLMAMSEEVLNKMAPIVNEEADVAEVARKAAEVEAAKVAAEAVANAAAAEVTGNEVEETTESYLKKAPPEIAATLNRAVIAEKAIKARLVKALLDNEKCTFTEVFLNTKDVEELQNMCTLAGGKVKNADLLEPRFNYEGQGPISISNVELGDALELVPVACGG